MYESALEAAQEHDAYVQFHARDMGDGYDEIDYMEISIAAGADGIILEFNGEESLKAEINKAVEAGIPVITIMSDAPDSSRQSFVGPNDYQVGQAYGKQIAGLLDEKQNLFLFLWTAKTEILKKPDLQSDQYSGYGRRSWTEDRCQSGKHDFG